jgi:hypothetical protein
LKTVTLGKKKQNKKNFNKKTDATWKTKKEKHYLAVKKKGKLHPNIYFQQRRKKKSKNKFFCI